MSVRDTHSDLAEKLRTQQTPNWLTGIRRQYVKTGTVKASDLRRLLGDQRERVETGPAAMTPSFFGIR